MTIQALTKSELCDQFPFRGKTWHPRGKQLDVTIPNL